ncbi:MAG TPA: VOC family protein, partial [Dehalococcoidia bacterium]|nr:VOC family protein [Dehalococcoidia bacterium]
MEKISTEKLPFSRVDQIGVIVRDMDKAVEYYQSLGIGPFESMGIAHTERRVYGKVVTDVKNVVRVARMGQVQLELVQPAEGKSIQREFLDRHGEGINHLGFFVDDVDKEMAKMIQRGFKVIASTRFVGGGGGAYFDTGRIGGVLLEVVQWPP